QTVHWKQRGHLSNVSMIITFAQGRETPKSFPVEAKFIRIPKNRKITLKTQYSGQYSAGGDLALIDFIHGGDNFKTDAWQGYEGADIDAVVDLGSATSVHRLSIGCLQDQGAWIFMPAEVTFWISDDGINFTLAGNIKNDVDEKADGAITREFSVKLKGNKTRYIKILAKNRGICPEWHPGAGSKAWLFADEITVE
ncbi:MAG: discoidin domain-containing protein, partial [Bacteroidota bacterium]